MVAKQSLVPNIDKLIFIMIDYHAVRIIGRKAILMSTVSRRLERTTFIFTRRTGVRLGGFNVYI
ncbi:MAG TPA: hypothetical protein G4N93_04125 [Dehalococcoidia bacterium]|nr:hypothetical protein [Dehalococcoidia bacterium]